MAWEVQANGQTVDDARSVLEANGIDPVDAKIQTLSGAAASACASRSAPSPPPSRQRSRRPSPRPPA